MINTLSERLLLRRRKVESNLLFGRLRRQFVPGSANHAYLPVTGYSGKGSCRERGPRQVTDSVVEVEGHNRLRVSVLPQLHRPVSARR